MQAEHPPLKPMGLGDILDTVFRLYRNNFLIFIGVVALIQIPLILLQIAVNMGLSRGVARDFLLLQEALISFDPRFDSWTDLPLGNLVLYFMVTILVALFEGIIAQQIINGALANAVSRRYLRQPVSITSAYGFGISRIFSLIIAGLLISLLIITFSLIVAGIFGLGIVLVAGLTSTQGGGDAGAVLTTFVGFLSFLAIFALIMLIIIGAAILFLFVTQAIVLEGHGAIAAMRRSLHLVRSSFWRVVGTVVAVYLMVQVLALIPTTAAGLGIGAIFNDPINDFGIRQSLSMLVSYGTQILVLPLLLIAYTVLYYDVRVRKEGFDLQWQVQQRAALSGE
jgi:hypothetical protein